MEGLKETYLEWKGCCPVPIIARFEDISALTCRALSGKLGLLKPELVAQEESCQAVVGK